MSANTPGKLILYIITVFHCYNKLKMIIIERETKIQKGRSIAAYIIQIVKKYERDKNKDNSVKTFTPGHP